MRRSDGWARGGRRAAIAVIAGMLLAPRGGVAQSLALEDPVLRGIWTEAMERSQVERLSQALLDSIGPRLTASPQMDRAQDWAVETFASWGIDARREQYGTWELPGNPGGGGSDYAAFVCWGAPGFNLGALSWDYGSHTWHTHRDTYDKVVFDDLRNNAVLTASLAYLAAEAPERISRERREILTDGQGRPVAWPECQPAVRRSQDSPRMQ